MIIYYCIPGMALDHQPSKASKRRTNLNTYKRVFRKHFQVKLHITANYNESSKRQLAIKGILNMH